MTIQRINLFVVLILCTQLWICLAQSSSFAGCNFATYQSEANLTISAASIDTTTTTNYTNVVFPNAQLPTQGCGDRFALCDLTLVTGGDSNTKIAVLAPAGVGAAVALFDKTQTQLVFLEQFFLQLPDTPPCSLTTFIVVDPFVYGFCYEFTNSGEVVVQVYRILLNFNSLNQSTVSAHIRKNDRNVLPYALRAFYFPCSGVGVSVHWYTDAFLYTMRIDIPSSNAILEAMDTEIQQCSGNATQRVVQFQDNSFLAYCGANTTAEIDICSRLDEIVTNTRFYCSNRRDLYLEVGVEVLLLINPTVSVFTIPFLLDMSVASVGDCVVVNEQIYFIASSVDGTIILTSVPQNHTTILTMDAPVNHQVIENRFILYSNSTSSSLLDLSCRDPIIPIHENAMTFNLANFSPNGVFFCFGSVFPTDIEPGPTAALPRNIQVVRITVSVLLSGLLIACIMTSLVIISIIGWKRWKQAQDLSKPEVVLDQTTKPFASLQLQPSEPKFFTPVPNPVSPSTETLSQRLLASLHHDQDTPPPENRDHVTVTPSLEPDTATQYEPTSQHSQQIAQSIQDSDDSPEIEPNQTLD